MNRNAYRLAVGTLFAGGIWLGLALTTDDQAHADTPPPAVTIERPAVLDRAQLPPRLPQQASARARAAVAKATAEPTAPAEPKPEPCEDQPAEPDPSTPAEPDPTTEPEPEPSDPPVEDKPAEDKPRSEPTPPVEAPPADEPPVEAPPVEVPGPVEPPVELPPVEVPPLPTPPPVPAPNPTPVPVPTPDPEPPVVDAPNPPPTDGGTAPKPQDPPLPAPAPVVVPAPLPVLGPVPAAEPPADDAPTMLGQAAAVVDVEVEWCPDEMRTDHTPDGLDMIGHLVTSLTAPAETPRAQSKPGCPGTPDRDAAPGTVQVKPPTQSAADTAVSSVTGSHVPPVLARLEHTRARSHLPAGRSQHIEPSPA